MELVNLCNGAKLVIIPLRGLKSVTIEVHLKIGSKYEKLDSESGMSHFLEHMAFKGTTKRPSPTEIFREIDTRGADFGAETGYESTSYQITTVKSNLGWAAELLSDIIYDSLMPDEEVNKERGVIIEEIKMYKDNPMMGMASEMVKLLYGKSDIGCWNISGETNDILSISKDKLNDFKNKYFSSKRMVITVAGNVKKEDISQITAFFDRKIQKSANDLPEVKIVVNNDSVFRNRRQVEQAHFVIALPTFGCLDNRRYAMKILNLILAGNTSSRLFEEVRSKRGWAYYVFPVGEELMEAGFWGVQVGVALEKLTEAMDVVETIVLSADQWINQTDVDRAGQYLKGKFELMMDKSDFWTGYVGSHLIVEDKMTDPRGELKKFDSVKLEELQNLCRCLFKSDRLKKYIISSQK